MKRFIQYFSIISVILLLLIVTSIITSYFKISEYQTSTLNHEIYSKDDLPQLFEDTHSDQVYIFIYDEENEDCRYIDEVLFQQISYQYNGIRFNDIYKVQYADTYRSYVTQILKNTFHVNAIPAIVSIEKTDKGYKKLDSFEYSGNPKTDSKNLEDFLQRNEMLTASHKD